MTALVLTKPTLTERVTQWARATDRPTDDVLEEAVQAYFDAIEEAAIIRETEVFWSAYDSILARYRDGFVAMRQGEVVDHDPDVSRLEQRVRADFGLLPVLIAPLLPPPPREIRRLGGGTRTETVF